MKFGAVGRTRMLYQSIECCLEEGHQLSFLITAKAAPEYDVTEEDFRVLAKRLGVPFLVTPKLDSEAALSFVNSLEPSEVVISVNYLSLIGAEFIDRFPLGVLNAHAGDLPRFRGNAPVAWAMLAGETRIGHCVHKMHPSELDAGDILCRRYFELSEDTRIKDVFDWLDEITPKMFVEVINSLENDPGYILASQPLTGPEVLRCYPRRPEDGKIFWQQPATQIQRLVNACSEPFAGAFCTLEGSRLEVWRCRPSPDRDGFLAVAGQVTRIWPDTGEIEIACGAGKLILSQVGRDGQRFSPADLVRSTRKRLE